MQRIGREGARVQCALTVKPAIIVQVNTMKYGRWDEDVYTTVRSTRHVAH